MDEVVRLIGGKRVYLVKALDDEGEVLDPVLHKARDIGAALKLPKVLVPQHEISPPSQVR